MSDRYDVVATSHGGQCIQCHRHAVIARAAARAAGTVGYQSNDNDHEHMAQVVHSSEIGSGRPLSAMLVRPERKPFFVIVHERTQRFATMDAAKTFTQRYFERTGNILGIGEN